MNALDQEMGNIPAPRETQYLRAFALTRQPHELVAVTVAVAVAVTVTAAVAVTVTVTAAVAVTVAAAVAVAVTVAAAVVVAVDVVVADLGCLPPPRVWGAS